MLKNLFKSIGLKLGPDFYGYNFFKGKLIDVNGGSKTPNHISFSQIQKKLGLKKIPLNISGCFNINKFLKLWNKYELANHDIFSMSSYKKEVAYQLSKIIENGFLSGSCTGCLIRFLNNNSNTKNMQEVIKEHVPDIEFIEFYGTGKTWENLLNEIEECKTSGKNFVVVVSRRGRMSNRFSLDIGRFIDLTPKYTNMTAAIQGFCGRAAAYGMQRDVILSDMNHLIMETWSKTLGENNLIPLHYRVEEVGNKEKKKLRTSKFSYRFDNKNDQLMDHLYSLFGDRIREQIKKGAKRLTGMWIPYDLLFPESLLSKFEKDYGFVPLRKGEVPDVFKEMDDTDKQFRKYHMNENEEIFVSFRTTEKDLFSGRNEKAKTTSMLQNPNKKRGIEPHLHVDPETGSIIFFEVAAKKQIKSQTSNTFALPISAKTVNNIKKASMFGDFRKDV